MTSVGPSSSFVSVCGAKYCDQNLVSTFKTFSLMYPTPSWMPCTWNPLQPLFYHGWSRASIIALPSDLVEKTVFLQHVSWKNKFTKITLFKLHFPFPLQFMTSKESESLPIVCLPYCLKFSVSLILLPFVLLILS
jgi:hypothetical protein